MCVGGANLQLSTRDEQLDVLAKVLSAGEDEAGIEVASVGDDVMRTKAALAQRTTGNLAALSGAHGLTYMEVWCRHCLRAVSALPASFLYAQGCHLQTTCYRPCSVWVNPHRDFLLDFHPLDVQTS